MAYLKVQLNHPGSQKAFKKDDGYRELDDGSILRDWNHDETHYRKFLKNPGTYLESLTDTEAKRTKRDDLFFWGEWEGNSFFRPLDGPTQGEKFPNGVHRPIHSTEIRGEQNTDPYVFGPCFKYAACKQYGQMENLEPGSVTLFGSTFPSISAFYLDTIFVVDTHLSAPEVNRREAADLSKTYREATLEQLEETYLGENPSVDKKLYFGRTWWQDQELFSFVPCRVDPSEEGFERLKLKVDQPPLYLSKNSTGKSYIRKTSKNVREVWQYVAEKAIEQGFSLGIQFDEPERINLGVSEMEKGKGACH